MNLKDFIKTNQQNIVLIIGYVLVAGLAYGLGLITASSYQPPEIRVEEAFVPLNDTPEAPANQSDPSTKPLLPQASPPGPSPAPSGGLDCKGQIKGNIGAEKVYHMPGGSFYNRTAPEACFATEAEAQAAGFRKSKN